MLVWTTKNSLVCFVFGLAFHVLVAEEITTKAVREMLSFGMGAAITREEKTDEIQRQMAALGRILFYDVRLSPHNTHSCNSCHDLSRYGSGGDHYLALKEQKKLFRDVPSIYNLKHIGLFGWAGSSKDLAAKISDSLSSAHEMHFEKVDELAKRLNGIPGHRRLFQGAFPNDGDQVTEKNITLALKAFIDGLVTPAPIDAFLSGDDQALTEKQLKGAVLFSTKQCFSCHSGPLVGGQFVMKLGVTAEWPNQLDKGYFEVSKDPAHVMAFRVASLRNVEKTAPYFHDYSANRLWGAIGIMARVEIGAQLSLEETDQIQEFLESLTGKISSDDVAAPEMPN